MRQIEGFGVKEVCAKAVNCYARISKMDVRRMWEIKSMVRCFKSTRIFLCLVILGLSFGIKHELYAQPKSIDSLKAELKRADSDSARLTLQVLLSYAYSGKDPAKSIFYARQVIADSAKASANYVTDVFRYKGYAHLDQNQYDSALISFRHAQRFVMRIGNTQVWLSNAQLISNCHRNMGNMTDAFKTAFKALRVADSIQDYRQMAQLNNQIGELYRNQNEAGKAIKYLKKAYSDFDAANITGGMMVAKANLALAYKQLDPEKALGVYQELLTDFSHLFRSWDSARVYSNLANIYLDLNRYGEAEQFLMRALNCQKRVNRPISLAFCYKELGELYVRTERPQEVVKYAGMAMDIANQYGHHDLQYQTSRQLADAYALLGEHEKAHLHLKQFMVFKDSILNEEKIELSNELEAKYSAEKKEQQIELQKEQLARQEAEIKSDQTLRRALIGGIVLLLIIAGMVYRNARLQSRKNREIKQFASRIHELQTTQSRWFTNIAHELRTPLTLILGPIQNALGKSEIPEATKAEIVMAKKYGDQLTARVNEILEISKLESGKLTLNSQPTDVVLLVKQVVNSFEAYAREKGVDMQFLASPNGLMLSIDVHKVTTIFNNLMANAIKFTPSGKAVRIELDNKDDGSILIEVIDSGIGISAEDLPHVFERFYQGQGSEHQAYGGSGVGLTLSQELAKLHGGLITVSSELGKGSTFSLLLPSSLRCEDKEMKVHQVLDGADETLLDESPNFHLDFRPKILLVEDHDDMRAYIKGLLQTEYEVAEAADGNQALEALKSFRADLIVSDVKMPGMDGLTFAKKVKELEEYKLTPFINLTAHANEKDKLTALKTGVDDYLVKPFVAEELLARVRNLISNAQARKIAQEKLTEEETQKNQTHDEKVMSDLETHVKQNLANSSFSVEELARLVAMSSSTLNRHVKKMTGLTPGKFIREIRLQSAIQLLESNQYSTVSEVVYAVGFEDVSSFSRLFKGRFGKSPSAYLG